MLWLWHSPWHIYGLLHQRGASPAGTTNHPPWIFLLDPKGWERLLRTDTVTNRKITAEVSQKPFANMGSRPFAPRQQEAPKRETTREEQCGRCRGQSAAARSALACAFSPHPDVPVDPGSPFPLSGRMRRGRGRGRRIPPERPPPCPGRSIWVPSAAAGSCPFPQP